MPKKPKQAKTPQPPPLDPDLDRHNQALAEISKEVFPDGVQFRIVEPKRLQLLKQNARYFKKETFKQLVDNIKKDRRLSSVPLCHRLEDGTLEVISGNHRVQAAIEAGIEKIMAIIILEDLTKSDKIAIQLSHNALVGKDDAGILADLWAQIEDIENKLYAGLSSDTVNDLEKIKLVTFTTPQVYTRSVSFIFTDPEKEEIDTVLDLLGTGRSDTRYLAHLKEFEGFFETIQNIKQVDNIKNASLAMVRLIEVAAAYLKEKSACLS